MENIQSYEDLKNNETIQSDNNLKILIKEIDEIKDSTTKDDDKIEGVFNENNENIKKTQNQGLIDSLNKQDKKIVEILINEINKIQNNNSLHIDNEVKDSLKTLGNLLSGILKDSNDTNKTKEIKITDIEDIKNIELTEKQIENIKKLKNLGIDIDTTDIEDIEDIELTEKQIENIKKLIRNLGFDIYTTDIEDIKDRELTENQTENIKKLKNLGIFINTTDIEGIEDIELTEKQIENIKKLKNLGIFINTTDIEGIEDIELTEKQIENIKKLKNLGIDIDTTDIEGIEDIELTEKQIENIKKIIRNLGFAIDTKYIEIYKDIELTEKQIENIKKIIHLDGLNPTKIEDVKDIELTEKQIENIKKLKNLGIDIDIEDIEDVKDIELTEKQIENIKKLKNLGIDIDTTDIEKIKDIELTDEEKNKIKSLILTNPGIKINIDIIINNMDIIKIDNKNFYEGYGYSQNGIESHSYYKKGGIIENIQQYVQNTINENRDICEREIINQIRSDLITIPVSERIYIIQGIKNVVKKYNTVRKYIDFENGPYKDKYPNAKALLCAIRGIKTNSEVFNQISNTITVKQHGCGLMFFVQDETSYNRIMNITSKKDTGSGGFNTADSEIQNLRGTLSVVNGSDSENYAIQHEGQHNRNSYFMPEKNAKKSITRAKDEITAYLRNGTGIGEIEQYLTKSELYKYDLEGGQREKYKEQVKILLKYVKDLMGIVGRNIGLTRDKVISMLSYTPADKRKDLHSSIMGAVKDKKTDSKEFWRTGTAEKKTEINEINLANSINEVKHILNDPKYSHISRIPNNKGGIEISAIIDEVVAKRLPITYIPIEIRQKVQELIRK